MNKSPHFRIAFLLSAVALLASADARADFIYTKSGVAGGWTPGDGTQGGNYGSWTPGAVSSSTSGSYGGSSASASVDLFGTPGIRLYSESFSNPIFGSGSETFSGAQWRDVIRVDGLADRPSKLRIEVEMEGVIQLNVYQSGPTATARVGIVELADTYGFFDLFDDGFTGDVANFYAAPFSEVWAIRQPGGATVLASNAQGLSYDPASGDIRWSATFDISYSSLYDGYLFNLYSTARTSSVTGAEATADFSHTMRLVGVTQTDGSSVPGAITFNSGFRLSAVPEPASLALAGMGVIGVAGLAIRRKRMA